MKKVRLKGLLPILLAAVAFGIFASTTAPEECTTAVVSSDATRDGRPILWKNRDTKQLSNKVVYVDEKPFS